MLDFLFITSPTNYDNPHPPYYFMYLAGYLRSKGLSVKILDIKKRGSNYADTVITETLRQTPSRFVGLAGFHSDYPTIMRFGHIVKHVRRHTTLLVGNAHPTIDPQDFIFKGSPFDVAVIGEGEETCWDLHNWKNESGKINNQLNNIKGIAYQIPDENKFVVTEPRSFLDIKDLPMPAYNLIDMEWYLRPQKLIIRRIHTSVICIFASRGCPFNCDFCAANTVWKANTGRACRLKRVDDVINEIQYLKQTYNIDFFYLFDDTFGMDKKWMRSWFEAKTWLNRLPYATQTRADICTEEMIKGLKETGCIQVDIGVEAGTQRLLNRVNKKITLDQIRQVFSWCRKYKIRSFATMLLNLPDENEEDLKATYQFIKDIKPSAGVIFGITTPYPGTKIYENYFSPKLTTDEYHLLIGNRLNPLNRFRMSDHNLDLGLLWNKWNRKFLATPLFERMWCLRPYQKLYWSSVLRSERLKEYVRCWLVDIPKTFLLWWLHKLRIYRLVKRIMLIKSSDREKDIILKI